MHPIGTLARLKRGEVNLILLVAFLAVLALPNGAYAASIPPQDCQAVLLFLQNDASLALSGAHGAGQAQDLDGGNASAAVQRHHGAASRFAALDAQKSAFVPVNAFGSAAPVGPVPCAEGVRPPGLLEWHEAISFSGVSTGISLE